MALEIERKYLVIDDSYIGLAERSSRILQGYLNRDPERTVRIRIIDDGKAFITVKGITRGDTRHEFEYPIPVDDALTMLPMCQGNILDKTRYYVRFGGFLWEVDKYEGALAPLVVAEIELPESGINYPLPPFVGEEVTGNSKYYNSQLA